jgi:hypothetical protein
MKANFIFSFGRGLNLYAANRATRTTKYCSKCGFFIIVVLENTRRVSLLSSVMPFAFVFLEFQAQYLPYFHHKDNFREINGKQTLK